MDAASMRALGNKLCEDDSNASNEVIIDIVNVEHGVVVTDTSSPYYNGYLV